MLLGVGIFVGLLALALMNREAVRFFFFFFLVVRQLLPWSEEPINNIRR